MAEGAAPFSVLLDQNISREVATWLRGLRPAWRVAHTAEVGLHGKPDEDVFAWAQCEGATIVTFDEDFADQRSFPVGRHADVVRLRVWPTTVEETEAALGRLFETLTEGELRGALVIIEPHRIRVRRRSRATPLQPR